MPKDIIGSGRLRLGLNPQTDTADSIVPTNALSRMVGQDADTYAIIERYTNALTGSPSFTVRKANGTLVAPTTVALNEVIGGLRSEARGNTKFWDTAVIDFEVDEAVVAGQRPASRISFDTGITNGTVTPRMILYADGQLAIGKYTGTLKPDTNGEPDSLLSVTNESGDQGTFLASYTGAGGEGGQLRIGRSRGTFAAPTVVADGDNIGEIEFFAYTGPTAKWQHAGCEIQCFVDGAVVADQVPPSRMSFYSSPVNTGPIAAFTLYSNGITVFGPDAQSAGLAYANAAEVQIGGNSGSSTLFSMHYSADDATSPTVLLRKSRNTLAAPAAGINNDNMGRFSFQCYNGTAWNSQARMNVYVDGVPVANQGQMTRIEFETTATNNGSSNPRVCINRLGVLALTTSGTAPVVSGNNYGAIQIMSTAPVSGIYLGNAANTATNVLDWYEEGTWTPALGLGDSLDTTGIGYTATPTGTFTRIGNRVWAAFNADINAWPGAGGSIGIKGIPYAINTAALQANGGSVFDYFNTVGLTSCPWLAYDTAIGTSGFRFQEFSATGLVDLVRTRFQIGVGIHGLLTYQCAT